MSNLWLNIRFGNYYLQAGEPCWYNFKWIFNDYHINNPKRFEIYRLPLIK